MQLTVDGKAYYQQLHVLVLSSFVEKPDIEGIEVNHKDGNKRNNRLDNLEWMTRAGNIKHSIENGLAKHARGESAGKSTLTDNTVKQIRRLVKKGIMYKDVAKKLNTTVKIVGDIIRGRTWRHV